MNKQNNQNNIRTQFRNNSHMVIIKTKEVRNKANNDSFLFYLMILMIMMIISNE